VNVEKALQTVNQAKELFVRFTNRNASKAYLTEQAKITAEIADEIVQAEITSQEKNHTAFKEKSLRLKLKQNC